jgi:hypothetical protein
MNGTSAFIFYIKLINRRSFVFELLENSLRFGLGARIVIVFSLALQFRGKIHWEKI